MRLCQIGNLVVNAVQEDRTLEFVLGGASPLEVSADETERVEVKTVGPYRCLVEIYPRNATAMAKVEIIWQDSDGKRRCKFIRHDRKRVG